MVPLISDQQGINLMSNTHYLLQYGVQSETPAQLRLFIFYASQDEWYKFAIPYPAGMLLI